MVMRIPEIGRIGQHYRGETLLPEGGMVTPSGIRQCFTVARHKQWHNGQVLRQRFSHEPRQDLGLLVPNHGEEIPDRGYGYRDTGWNPLRPFLVPGIADTFQ